MTRWFALCTCALALLFSALSPAEACWAAAPSNFFGVRGELAKSCFSNLMPSTIPCEVAMQPFGLVDEALGSLVCNVADTVKPPHFSSAEWLRASSLFLRPYTEIVDSEMGLCGANLGELSLRKDSA